MERFAWSWGPAFSFQPHEPSPCVPWQLHISKHDWHLQGRNVVLESKYGSPKIVNDGVTIAKEVELEDPVENIGAKLVRQVCSAILHGCHLLASHLMPCSTTNVH